MAALMRDPDGSCDKKPFPLDVIPVPGGWSVTVHLENGQTWHLLKPGWEAEKHKPYVFRSPEEAWGFIRMLFLFCLKQQQTLFPKTDKVMNCEQCGRVIRAKFFQYCASCLQENEHALQQIWRGFYYLTGSRDAALHKMSLLLKVSSDEFRNIPDAFRSMVQRHLDAYLALDAERRKTVSPEPVSRRPLNRMYTSHRHG